MESIAQLTPVTQKLVASSHVSILTNVLLAAKISIANPGEHNRNSLKSAKLLSATHNNKLAWQLLEMEPAQLNAKPALIAQAPSLELLVALSAETENVSSTNAKQTLTANQPNLINGDTVSKIKENASTNASSKINVQTTLNAMTRILAPKMSVLRNMDSADGFHAALMALNVLMIFALLLLMEPATNAETLSNPAQLILPFLTLISTA